MASKHAVSWRSVELALLVIYAIGFEVLVIWQGAQLSSEYSSELKSGWLRGLQTGWILGQKNDISDSQWRNFRTNLPILVATMATLTLTAQAIRAYLKFSATGMSWYWLLVSVGYISYLHGACVLFIGVIALGNYIIVKAFVGTRALPLLIWIYNVVVLVVTRIYEGFPFSSFGSQWAYLDSQRGILRWHISFNMVMLRMVSYGLDYHWAYTSRPSGINWEKHVKRCATCQTGSGCYVARQEKPLELVNYGFITFLSYILYPPLYIAGPIIGYNAFAGQLNAPQKSFSAKQIVLYGCRWLGCLLMMELLTHFCYFNALAISGVWQVLSPLQVFIIGYGVLNSMWLKFLLIWRFFRFWSLVAGIEGPENMLRCLNNCYDLEGFWKSWHASYNRWLVRYLYIPLGGARWKLLNVWIIFTFVAIWHDLEWKLLSWAWVTSLLMAPEILAKAFARAAFMQKHKSSWWFRECCALAGALNITGLVTANLVGFVIGVSGLRVWTSKVFGSQNFLLLPGVLMTFYVGTKIMLFAREFEASREIQKRVD